MSVKSRPGDGRVTADCSTHTRVATKMAGPEQSETELGNFSGISSVGERTDALLLLGNRPL